MRNERSAAQVTDSSETKTDSTTLAQEDLSPTKDSLSLYPNNTDVGMADNDGGRIVGGQDCKEGECPWQVTEWGHAGCMGGAPRMGTGERQPNLLEVSIPGSIRPNWD